jgi:hypothetical protein
VVRHGNMQCNVKMSRMKDIVDLGAGQELQPICHLANAFQHHEGPEILRPELAMPLPTAD